MAVSHSHRRKADRRPIRLMIVDDSIVARSVFQAILADHPEFETVAAASTAEQALARLDACAVDIVLLDLAMPGKDGLTALPEIIRRGRGARVLIVSSLAADGADACVRALTLGAADTLEKPGAGAYRERFAAALIEKLRRIGESRPPERETVREVAAAAPAAPDPALRSTVQGPIECLAIGSSTGGPHALAGLFAALPASCDMPIVLTQHLPASFMPYFAAQLTEITGRPTAVARNGDALRRGHILVAPGDAHLTLRTIGGTSRVLLAQGRSPSGCLPSVDPMLSAVANHFGDRAFAVVLTGMGRDGTLGARDIVERGGEIAVQDRATSVVWGMPGSIATAGLAATIASPAAIAARIVERIRGRGARQPSWT